VSPASAAATARRPRRPREEWEREILASARRTFAEEGYGVSINRLIEVSGAPVGTFYRCFADKEELFARVMAELHPGYLERLRTEIGDGTDPLERLRRTIEAMIVVGARDYADVARFYYSDVRGLGPAREVARRVEADELRLILEPIEAGVDSGALHCDHPEVAGWAIHGVVRRVTERYVSGRPRPPVRDAARTAAAMVVDGLRREQSA